MNEPPAAQLPDSTLVLLGAGGHAAVVAESAIASGWSVAGYLDDDDNAAPPAPGMKLLGSLNQLEDVAAKLGSCAVHAAVGDADLRRTWLNAPGLPAAGLTVATIVHPSACVSTTACMEDGAFIGPGAIVNARSVIGRGVIVNTGAIIEHDCELAAFAHIAPGAVLAGSVRIGEGSLIGLGATVLPGVSIGARCTLGAGAVVTGDVPDDSTCVGIPARVLQSS